MILNKVITPRKFDEIKSYFTLSVSTNLNPKKKLKKQISHNNLIDRPKLTKTTNKSNRKKLELSNMLEQIGKEDDIFNNDKLITNIKIETIEDTLRKNPIISKNSDKSFRIKKTSKQNTSLINLKKNIKNNKKNKYMKQNSNKDNEKDINNTTLELNCNKMPYSNDISKLTLVKKKQNRSMQSSRTKLYKLKNKNMNIKNVDQFINKPNIDAKIGNSKLLISPLSKQSNIKFRQKAKMLKKHGFLSSQRNFTYNINNNDSLSVTSHSKADISKSFVNGKSMQEKEATSNYMHFPSKSIIKSQEKVINELQKLFGEKLQLSNDTYKNMNDLDKINSINFLLDTIKEMNNINKTNKSKIDSYRELNENKEKQIKEQKSEIKGLKKEINKLNKLVKTNIQLNKKLEQNIEALKSQLGKEKEKNKSLLKEKGKSTSRSVNSFDLKIKNEKISNKIKRKKVNKSEEILQKANIYINRGKNKNISEKNINKKINHSNINVKTNINIIIKNKEEKKDKDKDKEKEKETSLTISKEELN